MRLLIYTFQFQLVMNTIDEIVKFDYFDGLELLHLKY